MTADIFRQWIINYFVLWVAHRRIALGGFAIDPRYLTLLVINNYIFFVCYYFMYAILIFILHNFKF